MLVPLNFGMAKCLSLLLLLFVLNAGVETFGKNAVVCGRSKNVGLPIAIFLHGDGERGNNSGEYIYLTPLGLIPKCQFA